MVGTRWNRLTEAVLTSTHNLCFRAKIRKNVYPCKSQFYYIMWDAREYELHGRVNIMIDLLKTSSETCFNVVASSICPCCRAMS